MYARCSRNSDDMFWLIALILLWLFTATLNQTTNNFGPYETRWERFVTCKGPKPGDCGKVRLENTQNMSDVVFVLDFPRDCPVTKAKVTIGSKQNNNSTKKLWNYSLDSPCQHFVLGPILVDAFNLTSSCKINKGYYEVHVNMNDKSTMFLGTSFFYGTYTFKIFAYNKDNNFFCVNTVLSADKINP